MKYDVYVIGNALVDSEFEVTEQFLATNEIEKGLMTLIDNERQQHLVANLEQSTVIKKRTGGGSGANSAVAMSRFGANTFYACKVAQDDLGVFYREDLEKAGVHTRLNELTVDGHTGQCLVMITPDAERTMNTYLGITSDLSIGEAYLKELEQAAYLYIEGYLVTSDTSRQAVLAARQVAAENGIKVAMTLSDPSMPRYFKVELAEVLGEGVDILFCNHEEALAYSGATDLESAYAHLQTLTKKLVVTLGAEGAMVIEGAERTFIAAHSTKVVDTSGAGDIFAGAFMYGMTRGMSNVEAGKLASLAASKVIAVFGARISLEEHQALLSQVVIT